ncbi:sodium:solute symporter [Qipengyuania sp.]|uniref:sodium:solute symporter n=1 Tax=Qipengyuania sp. TaxID=2004515 RepID=UPI003BAD9637
MSMTSGFAAIDWLVVAVYLVGNAALGWYLSRRGARSAKEYFLADGQMPGWLIAFSVLATTQSAATFLGGPDFGYRSDYTYLAGSFGAVLASVAVASILLPRFYAQNVTTVYELLERRYGVLALRSAAAMYLVGRIFANGARLFMAALAVAMILFMRADFAAIALATAIIVLLGLALTLVGGLRSVIASDGVQFAVYVGTAVVVLYVLYMQLGLEFEQVLAALDSPPSGDSKLTVFDFSFTLDDPFTIPAALTGVVLLNIGNFGLDQDTTQRLLAAKSSRHAGRALFWSTIGALPIIFIFLSIGQLLHLFYDRGDLTGIPVTGEDLDSVTIFMRYILTELPDGLKGLCGAAIVAAAVSTLTSGLSSMTSVVVTDFYKPWAGPMSEERTVFVGRIAMVVIAVVLGLMALVCFFWQRQSDLPLLEFALQVMVFAYAGLLGVFAAAVFTGRGSEASIIWALVVGFFAMVLGEAGIGGAIGVPDSVTSLAFSWKLLAGSALSFLVAISVRAPISASKPRHPEPMMTR